VVVSAEADPVRAYPRLAARTRKFTLGRPRSFSISADGTRVSFLRSPSGTDPQTCLFLLDLERGDEWMVADPRLLSPETEVDLPAAERARRERVREVAGGITAFAADPALSVAAFALGGHVYSVDLGSGTVRALRSAPGAFDPSPAPRGGGVAYVAERSMHVIWADGEDRTLAGEDDPDVSWGVAEFVAAEEMDRLRGYWWAPDGSALVAARVDESRVGRLHIADPSDPSVEPTAVRYPQAGTENADVSLWVLGLDGTRTEVGWDREALPYLVRVVWQEGRPLTVLVQSRDQRRMQVLAADARSGTTKVLAQVEGDPWLEIVDGVPEWTADGGLVFVSERDDARRLTVDGKPVTPPGMQVRRVAGAGSEVVFVASEEPEQSHVHAWSARGGVRRVSDGAGVHDAQAGGGTTVLSSSSMDTDGVTVRVLRTGRDPVEIPSFAERPGFAPRVELIGGGEREVRTAVVLPRGAGPDDGLPVLMDPYGGPHFQRVVRARGAYLDSQWFAEQGFAVVVADGRGTPARGLEWEHSVHLDLTVALEDQVDALHAAAERYPQLDLDRVAIRGWSFGGYLSALAVLRRPDVFHAAVVGAPVTDWRLYDTHYTERYLGLPHEQVDAYRRSSLLEDAARLSRPLLLIHGLADDNVLVANSLQFSRALLEAGRPHAFLPLSQVTHMTPQEQVAENLLLLQVEFLKRALGVE
jgi:dipeptidyl-peptidase-4